MAVDLDPNPYAAPSEAAQVPAPDAGLTHDTNYSVDFEHRRNELAKAERDILMAGSLILCAAIMLAAVALFTVGHIQNFMGLVTVVLLVAGAGLRVAAAISLWKLHPLGRVLHLAAVGVFVVHALLLETWMGGAPQGAWLRLIGPTLVVVLLWHKRSGQVFERHYVEKVIPATPNVRVRDGWFWLVHVMMFLFLLFGLFALAAVKLGWLAA